MNSRQAIESVISRGESNKSGFFVWLRITLEGSRKQQCGMDEDSEKSCESIYRIAVDDLRG